jgi:hypothetical protein
MAKALRMPRPASERQLALHLIAVSLTKTAVLGSPAPMDVMAPVEPGFGPAPVGTDEPSQFKGPSNSTPILTLVDVSRLHTMVLFVLFIEPRSTHAATGDAVKRCRLPALRARWSGPKNPSPAASSIHADGPAGNTISRLRPRYLLLDVMREGIRQFLTFEQQLAARDSSQPASSTCWSTSSARIS